MNSDFFKDNIKIIAVVVATLIIAVGFWSYFQGKQTDEAPDFTVTDIDGNPFTLSDFRDRKVVLLDFMSVTCPTCEDEMPELVKIFQKFGDRIQMISIDIQKHDTDDELRDFMEEHNANWRAARDADGELLQKYNIKEIVRVIIVDKEGKITYSHTGVSKASKLEKELEAADEGTAEGVEISSGVGLTALAIGAGIFAFFSPCAFPMLPGYMSFYLAKSTHAEAMAGEQTNTVIEGTDVRWEFDEEERKKKQKAEHMRKGMFSGIATALGIVFFYLVIGLLVSISGELVRDYISVLEPLIGLMLIILGIMMVENIPIGQVIKNGWITLKWHLFEKKKHEQGWEDDAEPKGPGFKDKLTASTERLISKATKKDFTFETAKQEGYFGLFSFGIGYGAASAGCCFPLFLAIILAALDSGGAAKGFFIFVVYAFSMAILMVIVTIFVSMSRDTLLNKMRSATGKIELIGGISLQIVGLYLIWYSLSG